MQTWEEKILDREKGREEEHARMIVEMVDLAMKNFHVDLETACKGLQVTVEEYKAAKEGRSS